VRSPVAMNFVMVTRDISS